MPPSDAPPPEAPSRRLGKFIIERRIASGGMADVYLARQVGAFGFAKNVALKVLKSEVSGDSDHVKMFLREALVAAEFRHPNLVQVYEVGQEQGKLFIAMELVRGISLATLMYNLAQQGRSVPIPLAVRIARDALEGLGYAHEARGSDGMPLKLVHRDVTPQNILLATDGGVKVVDFGIARAETVLGRTQATRIKGKFSYMAPEQWEPSAVLDARADLFGLSVVLYEMSTGSARLFKGTGAADLYKSVVRDPIAPPTSRVATYPEELSEAVMRGLERPVDKRWPTARAMSQALTRVMESQRWNVEPRVLAQLVSMALGGVSIEERWEKIDAGEIQAETDAPTVVDEVPPGAEMSTHDGLAPAQLPSMVAGQDTLFPPAAPYGDFLRSRASWGGLALGFGWILSLSLTGLWIDARRRASALESQVIALATRPPPPPPAPVAAVAPLVFLSDPTVAGGLGLPWARLAESQTRDLRVQVEPGSALDRLLLGASSIALVSGVARASEVSRALADGYELRSPACEHVVGYDHAVLVVHPSNPLPSVTLAQLQSVFTGVSRSFRPLRGLDRPPRVLVCGVGSPTRSLLEGMILAGRALGPEAEVVADENDALRAVAEDPRAVALVRLPWVRAGVRAVPVVGEGSPIAATRDTVRALQYPLARPLVLYTRAAPIGGARELLRAALSPAGQSVVERAGYVSP